VTGALRYPLHRRKGTDGIWRELAFFCRNRSRMHHTDATAESHAIGSGSVESANRVLVTGRMKRSGQGRGRDGGQGVLTFRALPESGHLRRACAPLALRLSRSNDWRPTEPGQSIERYFRSNCSIYASSHAAERRFCGMLILPGAYRSRLIAEWLIAAKLAAALPVLMRQSSCRKVTSRTQCRQFSTCQWFRM